MFSFLRLGRHAVSLHMVFLGYVCSCQSKEEASLCNLINGPTGCFRYLITCAIGLSYRFKYYFAWTVAETGSVASGFGFNGTTGEKNGGRQDKWYSLRSNSQCPLAGCPRDRCRNVNILSVEFASSIAKLPADWNLCTGRFLRRCKLSWFNKQLAESMMQMSMID